MRAVRLLDIISFRDEVWEVAEVDGADVILRNLKTTRLLKVAVSVLLSDETYEPEAKLRLPDLGNVAILETLPDKVREGTIERYVHVHELVTGVRPPLDGVETSPRAEYSLNRPQAERVESKVRELRAIGTPMSVRSLNRYISAFRDEGAAGLVDKRHLRTRSVGGRIQVEVLDFLERYVASQKNASTGTRSRALFQLRLAAEDNGWEMPSNRTVYRVLAKLERDRSPFGNATTRRTKDNRPDRAWGGQRPSRPGELVEIDSTPLDVMVLYPDGTTGKVDVTVAIDVATRIPLAAIVSPVATKSVDTAVLLARALTPLPMQPGWSSQLAYSRSVLSPGAIPEDAAILDEIAAKPIIIPESITIDRGKPFTGATFVNACERLQISLTVAAPRTPTDKPHIESFFRGLRTRFVQHLSGYTGPSVAHRGKNVEEEAKWTLSDLQNLLDLWIIGVYLHEPSDGLRMAFAPKRALTPMEAYASLAGVAPQVAVRFERDDYISLLPVEYRKIHGRGVHLEGIVYEASELAQYRGVASGLPGLANGKWEVRYDPYRMNAVWVRDHFTHRWIEARWIMDRQAIGVFSLDVLRAARKALGRSAPGGQVASEINRILAAPITRAERSASRRSKALQGHVPAKDAAAMSVVAPTVAVDSTNAVDEFANVQPAERFE